MPDQVENMPNYRGLDFAEGSHPHLGGSIKAGDPFTYCPSVWDYVISRFGVDSVLDLGSGCGNASSYFHKKGLKVIAIEGNVPSVAAAIYPTIHHDLTESPVITRVDLVYCQEVVEHIEETYVDNVIASLLTGRIILMTHALPGQDGIHHVNLQPPQYWIGQIEARGGKYLEEDSERIRKLAGADGAVYMAHTGLVFSNSARL